MSTIMRVSERPTDRDKSEIAAPTSMRQAGLRDVSGIDFTSEACTYVAVGHIHVFKFMWNSGVRRAAARQFINPRRFRAGKNTDVVDPGR